MSRIFKTFVLLLAINLVLIIIAEVGDNYGYNNLFFYFFIFPPAIIISLLILIYVTAVHIRKKYQAKDTTQKNRVRKKALVITAVVLITLLTGWVIIAFQIGYKIPQADRHRDWKFFPAGSNTAVRIVARDSLYLYNIEPIPGTTDYFVHFTNDSADFYDSSSRPILFGIMDTLGHFKLKYSSAIAPYFDPENHRLVIDRIRYGTDSDKTDSCIVYSMADLSHTQPALKTLIIPQSFEEFSKGNSSEKMRTAYIKKYRNDFFKSLRGIRRLEEKPYYENDGNRGYGLFTDSKGDIYKLKEGFYSDEGLTLLCPACDGYVAKEQAYGHKMQAPGFRMSAPSTIYQNHFQGNIDLGIGFYGNGNNKDFFMRYDQSWLLYYTINIGTVSTSFKLEGSAKNSPNTTFFQISSPHSTADVFVVASGDRIWDISRKGT